MTCFKSCKEDTPDHNSVNVHHHVQHVPQLMYLCIISPPLSAHIYSDLWKERPELMDFTAVIYGKVCFPSTHHNIHIAGKICNASPQKPIDT